MANQQSMINTRGRVVWVDENQVNALRERGWHITVNPKEVYYPQYDQSTNRAKEESIGDNTVIENNNYGDRLGIIVI